MAKQSFMIIDVGLCFDCNNCFMACKDEHVGNSWLPYTDDQPRHGHKWIDIKAKERGQYPRIDVGYLPVPCQHCEDAPCQKAFPEAVKRTDSGIVLIDPEKAKDVKELVKSCPYHAIFWNDEKCTPQKCTMCAHILDSGEDPKIPRCAHSCPTEAIRYVYADTEEFAKMIVDEELEVLRPELNTKPHVYYKNLYRYTKCFIWGEILKDGECAEGVEVVLKGNGVDAEVTTDCFGEFKFDKLLPGKYQVLVDGEVIHEINLKESANIGEFRL